MDGIVDPALCDKDKYVDDYFDNTYCVCVCIYVNT